MENRDKKPVIGDERFWKYEAFKKDFLDKMRVIFYDFYQKDLSVSGPGNSISFRDGNVLQLWYGARCLLIKANGQKMTVGFDKYSGYFAVDWYIKNLTSEEVRKFKDYLNCCFNEISNNKANLYFENYEGALSMDYIPTNIQSEQLSDYGYGMRSCYLLEFLKGSLTHGRCGKYIYFDFSTLISGIKETEVIISLLKEWQEYDSTNLGYDAKNDMIIIKKRLHN